MNAVTIMYRIGINRFRMIQKSIANKLCVIVKYVEMNIS